MRRFIIIVIAFLTLDSSLFILNSGAQWVQNTLPYDGIVYTLGFTNVNTGVACGHTFFPFYAKLYYTTNGGSNWLTSTYPSTLRVNGKVQFINSTLVYAGGAENGPFSNFKSNNPGFKRLPSYIRNKLISKGITEMYSEYKTAFIKSTNAGVSWQKVSTFDTLTGYMNSFHFFDANTGYALIDSNSHGNTRFYKTTNAGVSWQLVRMIDANSQLNDMYFSDINTGFVSGINMVVPGGGGVIYKTTNAGINWVKTSLTRTTQIEDLTFINSTTGFAVGIGNILFEESMSSKIYRTTNAGLQWDSINTFANHSILNLESLPSTGTVFGVGNLLDSMMVATKLSTIKTTNNGANWILQDINQITYGIGLTLIDQNNFMMCGGDINSTPMIPRIFKSTNGGNVFVNEIGSTVPSSYSLGQNYPNPFNPITNVKFSIVNSANIKIVVYDVMGKEVQTLVNERLQPGTYETSFNGSILNSGVYFYKLVTDGFTETKRMLLVK